MRSFCFGVLFLGILTGKANAQFVNFEVNDTTYVFGDKINVRSKPALDATTLTQLVAGDEVIILEVLKEKNTTLNGLDLPWCKVRFQNNQTGFVWAGLLSAMKKQALGEVRFVAGVVKATRENPDDIPDYALEIRAVKKGVILDKKAVNIRNEGSIHPRNLEPGARGLKGYRALLILSMGYEACGYPWNDWYVLWDGSKLQPLPVCSSVADAGAFSHVEEYLFPQGEHEDSPRHYFGEDKVYFSISHYEEEALETDDGGWNENSWRRVRPMRWDGKNWIRPKEMGVPK